jgi:hypothetical protein
MVKETKKFNGVVYKRYTLGTKYTASAKDVKRAKALVMKLREKALAMKRRGRGFYHVRQTRTSQGVPVIWYRYKGRVTGKAT